MCGAPFGASPDSRPVPKAADEGRLAGLLQPVERVFLSYPAVELDGEQTKKILNGARLDLERLPPLAGETVRVRSHTGRFLRKVLERA